MSLVPSTLLTGFLEEAPWKGKLEIGIAQTLFLTFLILKKSFIKITIYIP